MKSIMLIINIISIFLGVAALFYKDITYPTREKIMDVGLIQAAPETKKSFLMSSFLGGITQTGRIVLALKGLWI